MKLITYSWQATKAFIDDYPDSAHDVVWEICFKQVNDYIDERELVRVGEPQTEFQPMREFPHPDQPNVMTMEPCDIVDATAFIYRVIQPVEGDDVNPGS